MQRRPSPILGLSIGLDVKGGRVVVISKGWLQFNLASLFLLTTLVAIGLVWPQLWRVAGFGLAALFATIALSRLLQRFNQPTGQAIESHDELRP